MVGWLKRGPGSRCRKRLRYGGLVRYEVLLYVRIVRCDFHVEGSTKWWSETREAVPEFGDSVEHDRRSYTVIDLAGIVGGDFVLVTVRLRVNEPAMV